MMTASGRRIRPERAHVGVRSFVYVYVLDRTERRSPGAAGASLSPTERSKSDFLGKPLPFREIGFCI
jgi:hypothetical protein